MRKDPAEIVIGKIIPHKGLLVLQTKERVMIQ